MLTKTTAELLYPANGTDAAAALSPLNAIRDRGGTRSGKERRRDPKPFEGRERRSGKDRRSGVDRRCGVERRGLEAGNALASAPGKHGIERRDSLRRNPPD